MIKKIKKCKKCGVPLEGLRYKLIVRPLFKIAPARRNKDICNRCAKRN